MTQLGTAIKQFLTGREEGFSIVEYALLLSLIAAVVVVVLNMFGSRLNELFINFLNTV